MTSRENRGLLWPRATISKDCSSGTPARSIVASCRVKNVISRSPTFLPPRNVSFLIFWSRIPCRRRFVVTTVCEAALDSPRTCRLLRSTPSQTNVYSLTSLRDAVVAMAMVGFLSRESGSRAWFALLVGDGLDFLERGDALLHLDEARLPQVAHAFLLRLLGDIERRSAWHDELPHFIGDRHHLVDADPALVARALALVAANGSIGPPCAVEALFGTPGLDQRFRRDVPRL